jgi:hypothetical protein
VLVQLSRENDSDAILVDGGLGLDVLASLILLQQCGASLPRWGKSEAGFRTSADLCAKSDGALTISAQEQHDH